MMTLLAVTVGQLLGVLPVLWVRVAEIGLFTGFGLKLLYDGFTHRCDGEDEAEEAEAAIAQAEGQSPANLSALGVLSKTFGLVFLGEWGDRTQITTVLLAASHPPLGVALGALSGFGLCISLAVIAGRLVAGRISERATNLFAGTLFLLFAIAALGRAVSSGG